MNQEQARLAIKITLTPHEAVIMINELQKNWVEPANQSAVVGIIEKIKEALQNASEKLG